MPDLKFFQKTACPELSGSLATEYIAGLGGLKAKLSLFLSGLGANFLQGA